MRVIVDNKQQKLIDQDLFNYIKRIWTSFDVEVPECSNIYFLKNCTVNRLVTDYCEKDIKRVIKKEKAEFCIIQKFMLNEYPLYYDNSLNCLTEDDTQEVVYSIYNCFPEVKDTIEQIEWFINNNPDVIFVNQSKLNDSLNNGFVITQENYNSIKELVDSESSDNHKLACSMMINSNLKENWEWILYLYHNQYNKITSYDDKSIISDYIVSLSLGKGTATMFQQIDYALRVTKKPEVKSKLEDIIRGKFQAKIQEYFSTLGTSKFVINDFKIEYQE